MAVGQEAVQDTAKSKIDVDHADVFEYAQRKDTVIQKLIHNVELRQDSGLRTELRLDSLKTVVFMTMKK